MYPQLMSSVTSEMQLLEIQKIELVLVELDTSYLFSFFGKE